MTAHAAYLTRDVALYSSSSCKPHRYAMVQSKCQRVCLTMPVFCFASVALRIENLVATSSILPRVEEAGSLLVHAEKDTTTFSQRGQLCHGAATALSTRLNVTGHAALGTMAAMAVVRAVSVCGEGEQVE